MSLTGLYGSSILYLGTTYLNELRKHVMKQSLKTFALVGVLTAVCIGAQAAGTDGKATQTPAANAPSTSPGMQVFIDPKTGKLLEQPPEGAVLGAPSPALPEPVQVESPVPDGGVMVDVQGRFDTPLEATTGPDGKPVIRHSGEAPRSGHQVTPI